ERRGMAVFEIFALAFFKNGRRKWTKPFALLDACVQDVFHAGQAWMRQYGAVAQSARPPLHASLKPAYDVAGCDLLSNRVKQGLACQFAVRKVRLPQIAFNALVGKSRAEVGVLHHKLAGLVQHGVVGVKGCSNSQSLIAGRRLNPGPAKWCAGEKF